MEWVGVRLQSVSLICSRPSQPSLFPMSFSRVASSFLLCLLVAAPSAAEDLDWWQNAVFYQVYPRSFMSSRSYGQNYSDIGDLKGITKQLDYIKSLGVTGIWMNPIYLSPQLDMGYDVSNFIEIDPMFGTMDDLKDLIKKAKDIGLKILMDFVPNHTSDQHPWFKEALKGNSNYTNYYVWTKQTTNWKSVMGGSAWERVDVGKYYYHAFLPQQPDLNYRNKDVINEMKEVMRFYLNLTVDGFRVDAVPYLVESNELVNEPNKPGCGTSWSCYDHIYTMNQNETFDILSQFKEVLDEWSNKTKETKIMVVEATLLPDEVMKYYSYNNKDTSTMAFNFQLLSVNDQLDAKGLEKLITDWTKNLPSKKWSNWVLGNHDQRRIGSKTTPGLVDGMNMVNLLLPGTSFTYYGEELGMTDTKIRCDQVRDPQAIAEANRTNGGCPVELSLSRDPERTPMQWSLDPNAGFSVSQPWLPVNPNYFKVNVKTETDINNSHLNIYKNLINLKNEMVNYEELETHVLSPYVFSFKRFKTNTTGEYIVIVNLNNYEESVNTTGIYNSGTNIVRAISSISTRSINDKVSMDSITLLPNEAIVLAMSSAPQVTITMFILVFSVILSLYR